MTVAACIQLLEDSGCQFRLLYFVLAVPLVLLLVVTGGIVVYRVLRGRPQRLIELQDVAHGFYALLALLFCSLLFSLDDALWQPHRAAEILGKDAQCFQATTASLVCFGGVVFGPVLGTRLGLCIVLLPIVLGGVWWLNLFQIRQHTLSFVLLRRAPILRAILSSLPRTSSLVSRIDLFLLWAAVLLGQVARHDGAVSPEERTYMRSSFRERLQLSESEAAVAMAAFEASASQAIDSSMLGQEILASLERSPALLHLLLDVVASFVAVDGTVSRSEEQLLSALGAMFHMHSRYSTGTFSGGAGRGTSETARPLEGEHAASDGARRRALEILGLPAKATLADIKRQFRKLAKEFHPDSVVARGAPESLRRESEQYFIKLREAFEYLVSKSGVR